MKTILRSAAPLAFACAGVLLLAQQADAACGIAGFMKPTAWQPAPAPALSGYLHDAVFRPNEAYGALVRTASDEAGGWHHADIVGQWLFVMTVAGPSGPIVVDDGYNQYHADGTEIMNSGGHSPDGSNFCLGVWEQTGPATYKFNHFPLAWDATGSAPVGPVHLTGTLTLKDHDHFTGTFTLDAYNYDGTEITNAAGGAFMHATGTITGTRVTMASKVPGT